MNNLWDGPLGTPTVRTVKDMAPVLASPEAGAGDNTPLYFMYRALSKNAEDDAWMKENNLRFDVTRIPAGKIGHEFVKTKGHYHPNAPCGRGYPELYQVLEGEAHFLLQKKDLSDVCAVRAKAGDVVLIRSGYGHVTINPSDDELLMANIVSCAFESEYEFYTEMHGAAYYELDSGFVKNPYYKDYVLPQIRILDSFEIPALGLYHKTPIYDVIGKKILPEFLNNPKVIDDLSCPICRK